MEASLSKKLKLNRTIREIKNRRQAVLLIGAANVDALEARGLQVVPVEHAEFLYHADELKALGLDLKEELLLIRNDP